MDVKRVVLSSKQPDEIFGISKASYHWGNTFERNVSFRKSTIILGKWHLWYRCKNSWNVISPYAKQSYHIKYRNWSSSFAIRTYGLYLNIGCEMVENVPVLTSTFITSFVYYIRRPVCTKVKCCTHKPNPFQTHTYTQTPGVHTKSKKIYSLGRQHPNRQSIFYFI